MSTSWKSQVTVLATIVGSGTLGVSTASAAITWNGGGSDDNWSTPLNWGGTAAANNGTTDVRFAGSTRLTPNVDTNNPWHLNSLQFNNLAGNFVIGGNAIDIDSGISGAAINMQSSSGQQTINSNLNFSGSSQAIVVGYASSLTLGGAVTSAGALTYKGASSGAVSLKIATAGSLDVADFTVQAVATTSGKDATLQLLDNTSLADTLTLRLVDATSFAKVNLASGTELASALYINGVRQANGTYGGTGGGAQFIDTVHFTGTGILSVPEPATATMIGLVGTGIAALRRRRVA